MSDITDISANHLHKFGKIFRISLIMSLIVSGFTAGIDFIQAVDLVTMITFRLALITFIIFRILMWLQLFNVKKTEDNRKLSISFAFFTCNVVFSIINQILGVVNYFSELDLLNYISFAVSLITLLSEILFWTFFLQFLLNLQVNFFNYLLKNVRFLLVVLYFAFAINILYYIIFTFFVDFFYESLFIPLLIAFIIVGICGLIFQFRISNGIIKNFGI